MMERQYMTEYLESVFTEQTDKPQQIQNKSTGKASIFRQALKKLRELKEKLFSDEIVYE